MKNVLSASFAALLLWCSVPFGAQAAPTVSITAPANNAVFAAPATIAITANATPGSSGSAIAKVDFYNGSALLGTKTSSPYTFSWKKVAAGTYSLTAKATDKNGLAATSSAVTVISNKPPTVAITAPANNAVFTAPATIAITASATAASGNTIVNVDFYSGSTLLGTRTAGPYTFSWTSVAAGTYSLTAKAADNKGSVTTSKTVIVTVVAPPTVSITAPANNMVFSAPATIAITASATRGSNGSAIAKVDFYNGSTLLGTKTTSPYTFSWANVAAGTYSLNAKATDKNGLVGTSSAVAIQVGANQAPTVAITAPANAAVFSSPAIITINAAAADADGTVSKVEFYSNGTLLGNITSPPYTYAWTNVGLGTYTLAAKAYDNLGAVTTSAAVAIQVAANQPPTVAITAPSEQRDLQRPSDHRDQRHGGGC